MGYISKDGYERKAAAAAQRMAENAEVDTLTEDQHEALAWLCAVRHEMHTTDADAMYYTEYADSDLWANLCGTEVMDEDGEIQQRLADAGLPAIQDIRVPDPMSTDADSTYMSTDELLDVLPESYRPEDTTDESAVAEAYSEYGIHECREYAERVNTTIEQYLRAIDEEHGTSYCPSGATRIY